MTCDMNRIQDYLDERLTLDEKATVDRHLAECEACRREWTEMSNLKELLSGLPDAELPENFREDLHEKLLDASIEQRGSSHRVLGFGHFKRHKKAYGAIAAVFLVGVVSIGVAVSRMGAKDMVLQDRSSDFVASAPAPATLYAGETPQKANYEANGSAAKAGQVFKVGMPINTSQSSDGGKTVENTATVAPEVKTTRTLQSRKVIRNGSVQLEVTNYDDTVKKLTEMATAMGGYLESMDSGTQAPVTPGSKVLKQGSLTLRIPQGEFMKVYQGVGKYGRVDNASMTSEDVTSQYRDTYNQALNLETREKQLREIMTKAVTVPDILAVDGELSRVRGDINQLKGTLQQWDDLVQLSRLTVSITEVQSLNSELTGIDKGLVSRIQQGFINSFNRLIKTLEILLVVLIIALPWLAALGGILWIFLKIARKVGWIRKRS